MTLRTALTYSYNVPAVKISEKYGNSNVLALAKKMGITTLVEDGPQSDNNSAMALGGLTHGVTPLEMPVPTAPLQHGQIQQTHSHREDSGPERQGSVRT